MSAAHIIERSLDRPQQVNAWIGPEIFIFSRDGGIDHRLRDIGEFDARVQALIRQLANRNTLAIIYFQVIAWQQRTQPSHLRPIPVLSITIDAIRHIGPGPGYREKEQEERENTTTDGQPEAAGIASDPESILAHMFTSQVPHQQFLTVPPALSGRGII